MPTNTQKSDARSRTDSSRRGTTGGGEPATAADHARESRPPRLRLGAAERLELEWEGKTTVVTPVRCFPWSAKTDLLSLRDDEQREVLLIERLDDLDPVSQHALQRSLGSVGFVLEVCQVDSIEEDFELRVWKVQTRQGARTFQTALDEWPWPSPDGGYFVRDLSGDLFLIPRPETLDAESRRKLWAYVG